MTSTAVVNDVVQIVGDDIEEDGNRNAAKGSEFGLALLCVFVVSGAMVF